MKVKMLEDYQGFITDEKVLRKDSILELDNKISSYLLLYGYAEEVVKLKAKPKAKPKAKAEKYES